MTLRRLTPEEMLRELHARYGPGRIRLTTLLLTYQPRIRTWYCGVRHTDGLWWSTHPTAKAAITSTYSRLAFLDWPGAVKQGRLDSRSP